MNILSVIDYPCVYFAKQNSKLRARNKELEEARQQAHRVRIQVVLRDYPMPLCRLFYVILVFPSPKYDKKSNADSTEGKLYIFYQYFKRHSLSSSGSYRDRVFLCKTLKKKGCAF